MVKVDKIFSLLVIMALVLSLGVALMPASPVEAATPIYVNGTTGDDTWDGTSPTYVSGTIGPKKTIQAGINVVDVDGTVNVAAGTYQEDITINKGLTLQGAGRTITTILRNTATDSVVLIQANNVKITGFKIDGGTGPPYPCNYDVRVAYGAILYENAEVSDCHLIGAAYNAVEMYPDSVGHVYKVNDNIIEHFGSAYLPYYAHPTFIGVGITFGNALDVEAKRNIIRNSEPSSYTGTQYGGYAIYLMDYTGGTIEDNTISDCIYGITLNSVVEETWVNRNTISNCHRGILQMECFAKLHITNNSITTRRDPANPASAKYKDEWGILIGGDGDFYNSSPPYNWQVDNLQHEVSGNTITGTSTTQSVGIGVVPGWYDKDYGASGTFTGNSISGYKYGLKVWGTYTPPPYYIPGGAEDMTSRVHVSFGFNNIVSCITDAAVDTVWSGAAGGINAENNWWGSNSGPSAISDKFDFNPWLVIGISANPTSIVIGGGDTSQITADMTKNSAGVVTGPPYILDGTQIIFTTNKGSIGSLTVNKTTTNGRATATLTSSNTVETATVCAEAPHGAGVPEAEYKVCTAVNFVATPQTVTTNDATNIMTTGARLNGNLTSLGTATSVNVSFQWGTTSGVYPNETVPQAMTTTGNFFFDLTGLTQATTYYFRAKADGGIHGTGYGAEKSFITAGVSYPVGTATGTGTASFSSNAGNITNLTAVDEGTLPTEGKPPGVTFPHGLFSFNITNIAPGSCVTITITYPSALPIGTQYWKYQAGIGWFQIPIGDDNGDNVITIQLCDGGLGDADGVANGTIVDPGGPAVPAPPPPPPPPPPPKPKPRLSPPMPAPPYLLVEYLRVDPPQTYPNNPVEVTANVVNSGGSPANYTVDLVINGYREETKTVTVGAYSATPVKFYVYKAQPGTYNVAIDGQEASFTVIDTSPQTTGGWTLGSGGIIALIVIGIMLLVGVAIAFTRLT